MKVSGAKNQTFLDESGGQDFAIELEANNISVSLTHYSGLKKR